MTLTTPTLEPSPPPVRPVVIHFTHGGRRYRLAARTTEPGASLYLCFEDRGERIIKSTGCPDRAGAIRWARAFLDARRDDNQAALDHLLVRGTATPHTSTVGELLNWFTPATNLGISDHSRRAYAHCLRNVLRGAGHAEPDPLPLARACTSETVHAYLEHIEAAAAEADAQDDAARIRRSAASILNQAKAVFSLLTTESARRAGVVLPELTEFLRHIVIARKRLLKGSGKVDFRPPDDTVIAATLAAWRALDVTNADQRNAYVMIWLALSCGLRISEIGQARWEWVTQRDGVPLLQGSAFVKNRTGELRVRPIDPFWNEGLARFLTLNPQPSTPFLTTQTPEPAARTVSDLMRSAGWRTQKAAHALRALSGSWVAAQWGIFTAQGWLRHASVTTTERSYTVLLRDQTFKPMPVTWAGNLPDKATDKKPDTHEPSA